MVFPQPWLPASKGVYDVAGNISIMYHVSCIMYHGIHYVWRCGVVPNLLVLKVFRNYGRGEGGPKSATKYGAAQFKE